MCYFLSVGAKAPARLMTQIFDEQAELNVAVLPVSTPVAQAFPADDQVCLVTWRGCSCDFVGPSRRALSAEAAKLVAGFRSSVVSVAKQLGSVRLLVHRHRQPYQLPAPGINLSLSIQEFLERQHWFVEDVVMEICEREAPPRPSFS